MSAEARLDATIGMADEVSAVRVDGVEVADLAGRHAIHGMRAHLAASRPSVTSPEIAVLFEIPVGVTLSGYARMQSGRQAGKATADVIDPAALPVLADSCAGWASDGPVMTSMRTGDYHPPRLPPQVPGPDLAAWHDLGALGPWWVRRRKRVDVDASTTRVHGGFRDSWIDGDGIERALHEWEVDLDLDEADRIVAVRARPRSLPFAVCPSVASRLDTVVGTPVSDLRAVVAERLGGVVGCTHLNDLLGVVPTTVAAAREGTLRV